MGVQGDLHIVRCAFPWCAWRARSRAKNRYRHLLKLRGKRFNQSLGKVGLKVVNEVATLVKIGLKVVSEVPTS